MPRSLRVAFALPFAIATFTLLSCQGSSPTSTTGRPEAGLGQGGEIAPALIPGDASAQPSSFNVLGGVYTLDLALTDTPTATLTPMRMASAKGDAYELDATNFLRVSPCTDCVQVTALRKGTNPGEVEVDFALRHPFALPTQPYTSASRLDLHAFDVMGYLLSDASTPLALGDGDTAAPVFLQNADGYSDLLDSATELAYPTPNVTEHPYRVFYRDATAGNFDGAATNGFAAPDAPSGHNVMAMGAAASTATFVLQVPPSGQLNIGFAVGLSWGQPAQGRGANLGQRQNPVYYLPEFHHKAPWTVTASISNNNLQAGSTSSNATLDIALRDWQLGATTDPAWEFGTTARDGVKGPSELSSLTVYAPGLLASPLTIDPSSGTGTGVLDDLTFSTVVTNSLGAGEGTYAIYVKAVDSRSTGGAVLDRNIQPVNLDDFHTGTVVMVDVVSNNTPPTAAFVAASLLLDCTDCTKNIDASASTDAEDPGDLDYEFDWDVPSGDPLQFVAETPVQSTPTISHQFDTSMPPAFIGVRVTDPQGAYDVAVLPVSFDPVTLGSTVSASPFLNPWVQYFNYDTGSASANLASNGSYVFLAVERHNGSGAAAGANSEFRVFRTPDGVSWETLASVPATNPYNPVWADYAIAAGSDGDVFLTFAVQDGGNYSTDWETRIYANANNGTAGWVPVLNDTSVAAQPNSRTLYVDAVDPNLVILQTRMNSGMRQWRSTTGAAGSFTLTSPYGGNPNGVRVMRKPSGHLVATYLDGSGDALRAQTSIDAGQTWSLTGSLLLDPATNWFCGCGAMDPTDPTGNTLTYAFKLYQSAGIAGTPGIHLARSTNGGATWTDVNAQIETTSPYTAGDPAIIRAAYDNGGGLYVTYFKALWGADLRGFVAYSGDNGTTFLPDEELYDTTPAASWPGCQLAPMPDGCSMISAYSRMQFVESRTI